MRSIAPAIAALAFLAGCGSDEDPVILSTERVERAIEQSVKEQRKVEADVSCPDNVEQRKGNDFTCIATVDGRQFEFNVTQTDDDGHVEYEGV